MAAAAQVAKSPLSLVDAKPSNARDRSSDHTDEWQRADELATLLQAAKVVQPPSALLQPKLPNPATERGSVDVSFSGGHKVGSRLKRCLPGVNPRCVLVGGRSSQ